MTEPRGGAAPVRVGLTRPALPALWSKLTKPENHRDGGVRQVRVAQRAIWAGLAVLVAFVAVAHFPALRSAGAAAEEVSKRSGLLDAEAVDIGDFSVGIDHPFAIPDAGNGCGGECVLLGEPVFGTGAEIDRNHFLFGDGRRERVHAVDGQSVEAQVAELTAAGASKVLSETASGARSDRAQLGRVVAALVEGDVLLVTRLDRLARSTRDLLNVLAAVAERRATFRSLGDAWADTTTPHGRLMLTVLGGLAEFERELIVARTSEGRVRARARGVKLGPKYNTGPTNW